MRNPKRRANTSHVGGLNSDVRAIIPPAAALFDVASRPENDPILQATLSSQELAAIATQRQMADNFKGRKYSVLEHANRLRRGEELKRANQRISDNLVAPRKSKKVKDGHVFSLNRATEIVPPAAVAVSDAVKQERKGSALQNFEKIDNGVVSSDLDNVRFQQQDVDSVVSKPENAKPRKKRKSALQKAEELLNKDVASQIVFQNELFSPESENISSQEDGQKENFLEQTIVMEQSSEETLLDMPTIVAEEGGSHLFGASLGINLRADAVLPGERPLSRPQVEALSPKPRRKSKRNM